MTIRPGPPEGDRKFDICVVGSGPAGLAVALACGARGHAVIMLESGGKDRAVASTAETKILDRNTHAEVEISTRQQLGGTSSAWGGGCIPLDPIDFAKRMWVPNADWPICYEDLSRFHSRAGDFLNCGDNFDDGDPRLCSFEALDIKQLGRYARYTALGKAYFDSLASSSNVLVCLHSEACRIVCNNVGYHAVGIDIKCRSKITRIFARRIVLAAGGLNNTRLLLELAKEWPLHFDGGSAPLGNFYMGHISGDICTVKFNDPQKAIPFLYRRDRDLTWTQRRLKFLPSTQSAATLLNTAFTLRAPLYNDPTHADGALSVFSLLSLMSKNNNTGKSRRIGSGGVVTGRHDYAKHASNILRRPISTVANLGRIIGRIAFDNVPAVFLNSSGRYVLRYHAEQIPNHLSRVFLDESGPHLNVDFRYLAEDISSVVRAHEVLDKLLRASGLGCLDYHVAKDKRYELVETQAHDGYHQIGTTRMSVNPSLGIVDAKCRVHGIPNLYVASSSLFPSSGSANPTFSIVAIAFRIADHICCSIENEKASFVVSGRA